MCSFFQSFSPLALDSHCRGLGIPLEGLSVWVLHDSSRVVAAHDCGFVVRMTLGSVGI